LLRTRHACIAGLHETRLADIAASIGGSLAGDWFEDYIGSAAMAVAAGIVIAQVRADFDLPPGENFTLSHLSSTSTLHMCALTAVDSACQ